MVIKGYNVGALLRKTGQEILDDNVLTLAAATAYSFFFSLFPLFLFAAPLVGLIGNEQRVMNWIMQQLAQVVPADAFGLVRGVVQSVVFAKDAPGIVSIGAVLTAWSAANIFRSLMDALNQAYDVTETRPFWKRGLLSLAAVIATGLIVFIAATVMLAGPEIIQWLGRHLRLEWALVHFWTVIQYPIAFILLIAAFFMVYRFLPNLKQSARQILVGSTVGAFLWVLVTLAFRLYVTNFGSYNKTYGTIGAVIVLLTWMYLSMVVVLAGGELNSELHHGAGAIEPRKGAVYAGRIVTAAEPSRPSTERVVREPLGARGVERHSDSARG